MPKQLVPKLGGRMTAARQQQPKEDGLKWHYNEEACAVLHDLAADCKICIHWYHHYTSEVYPYFSETLKRACAERDHAHEESLQSEIDAANRMRHTAVRELAAISAKLKWARVKLHAVRQKRADAQVTAHHQQDRILSDTHEVVTKLRNYTKGTSHVCSRQLSPRRKYPVKSHIHPSYSAEQQAQDQDDDDDGVWIIPAPTSTASSGPQANVPGTSSGVVFK
ncbi:hypothetical protein BC826DRAFT_967916 [Russula brevipes]|nr:hypothetical protein BC826DRAFT_967916 [Russula brevipes]